jgi:hypothetical protein
MKIPINCEEMQYFPEEDELSEPDDEDEEEKE